MLHHLELHISGTNVANGTLQSFLKINQCGLFCGENTKWRMMLELQQGLEIGGKGGVGGHSAVVVRGGIPARRGPGS